MPEQSLIIVESPAKARTIKKFLTRNYEVKASMGHVRDLPKSQLGIDLENHFHPKYIAIKGKSKIIKELKAAAKKSGEIYLATDPDREGEAIAWHLSEILELPKAKRIELREITKSALNHALTHAKTLDLHKVDAQQARRILDRLVGYKLSPLLWKKVKSGLSAGRVQSVAVKLICEREREIQAFQSEEYWTITAHLFKESEKEKSGIFPANLIKIGEEKASIGNETTATGIVQSLEKTKFLVQSISQKEQQRHPPAPFITSTLQQDANRKLGFKVSRTMAIAQQLYEGLNLGKEGSTGLITYMRTDSPRVSSAAHEEARSYIFKTFSKDYFLGKEYKIKESAQDAHEAIRPTSVFRTPDSIQSYVSRDQYQIYKLIWERFLASQMSPARFLNTAVDISAENYLFRATGSLMKFPGFLAVYQDSQEEEEKTKLPELTEGETLPLDHLEPKQHFTQPPPRFTEASLVKTLEENGIGRPSTYAPIIETILHRRYVELENKHFIPSQLGFIVTDLLQQNFSSILNVDFTAAMENKLDEIEEGKLVWESVLSEFYNPFEGAVAKATETLKKIKVEPERIEESCPNCGKGLVVKEGRFGRFIACSGYPDCRYTRNFSKGTGISCPKSECGGEIMELRTKKGKPFYGCSKFPQCDFRSWDRPTKEICGQCGSFMVIRVTRKGSSAPRCSNKECPSVSPKKKKVGEVAGS